MAKDIPADTAHHCRQEARFLQIELLRFNAHLRSFNAASGARHNPDADQRDKTPSSVMRPLRYGLTHRSYR